MGFYIHQELQWSSKFRNRVLYGILHTSFYVRWHIASHAWLYAAEESLSFVHNEWLSCLLKLYRLPFRLLHMDYTPASCCILLHLEKCLKACKTTVPLLNSFTMVALQVWLSDMARWPLTETFAWGHVVLPNRKLTTVSSSALAAISCI